MSDSSKHFAITGISSGLGLALTRELLGLGHRVSGCARRGDPLAGEASIERYRFRQADILDAEAMSAWADECIALAPVDFLVHNAAVIHRKAPLAEIGRGELEATIRVNVNGAFDVARAFVPRMTAAGRGVIVLMSSGAGRRGILGMSGYCASKWAIEGLAKSLAEELPDPLAAIPLAPGVINTPMLQTIWEDAGEQQTPEQWASRAAPFLLGLSRKQNGESLRIPAP